MDGVRRLHQGALEDARARLGEGSEVLVARFAQLFGAAGNLGDLGDAGSFGDRARRFAGMEAEASARLELLSMAPSPRAEALDQPDRWSLAAARLHAFAHDRAFDGPGELSDDPVLRVQELALRALSALQRRDLDRATHDARCACRAAYAESLPNQEYLSYYILARTRRITGSPYAAARIAGALARAVPSAWRPLVDWELALAGGRPSDIERPFEGIAHIWFSLCRAAEAGDAAAVARAEKALRHAPLLPVFDAERQRLLRGLRAFQPDDARDLAGALGPSAEALGQTPAVWCVGPGEAAALRWCVFAGPGAELGFSSGERNQRLLSTLARGPADIGSVFRDVYGFALESEDHQTMIRVLLHRTRASLKGAAQIVREGDHLRLACNEPCRLPEPSTAPPYGDRILRAVALNPGATASEISGRTGMHLRSVQRTLRLMGETGACIADSSGRRTVYRVEDTTFSEPTHFRVAT
ncbi:MAG: hypothetical protein AAF938_28130 [Myxococcota bacterium]